MLQPVTSKDGAKENLVILLKDEELPEKWRIVSIWEISKAISVSINPQHFPEEVFEYYSIPAFQEHGRPVLEQGKQLLILQ